MADKKERVDRGAAIKLLDRAAALEMARKTNWTHEWKPWGPTIARQQRCKFCDAEPGRGTIGYWCPAKIADALLEVRNKTMEYCATVADNHENHIEFEHGSRRGCPEAIAKELRPLGEPE